MSKTQYALKANATDELQGMIDKGTKATGRRTYKRTTSNWPDVELIVSPSGKLLATLSPGTNGAWLLISVDMLIYHRLASKPSLLQCLNLL